MGDPKLPPVNAGTVVPRNYNFPEPAKTPEQKPATQAQQANTGWVAGAATGTAGRVVGSRAQGAGETAAARGPAANTAGKIDNQFKMVLSGGDPVATGSALNQTKQAVLTTDMSIGAAASWASNGRLPPDFLKNAQLRSLSPTPPIPGEPTAKAVYTSNAKGSPQATYDAFTKRPSDVFGAAGLKFRPAVGEMKDGGRAFIEDGGPPPVWLPVQFKLDPENKKVTITTLDGHAFRGTNEFEFKSDGKGGTNLVQTSNFQGSSPMIEMGKKMGGLDRQHAAWEAVHQHIAKVK